MTDTYTDHPDFNLPDEDEKQTKLSQDLAAFIDSCNTEGNDGEIWDDDEDSSDKDDDFWEMSDSNKAINKIITESGNYLADTVKDALDERAIAIAEDLTYQRLNVSRGNRSDLRFEVSISDRFLNDMINNLCFDLTDAVEHTKASLYACQALKNIIKSEDVYGLVNMAHLLRQYFLLNITDYLEDLGIATKGIIWWWVHQILNTNPKNIWVDVSQPPVHSDEADKELFLVKTEKDNYTIKTYDFTTESWGINIKAWMCISKPEFL